MSVGKLCAQVCHASMAFLSHWIRDNMNFGGYVSGFFDDCTTDWFTGSFTKTVCEAKNRRSLEKAIKYANELGLCENEDFWLIKDNCLTELDPEEFDENGIGRTLTCIGFRPLADELAHEISKHFQLYK